MNIRVICSFLVISIIRESLQIELDGIKAESPRLAKKNNKWVYKKQKTKPYGKTLMEDTPKQYTLQGYLRKTEAVRELMMISNHRTRNEMNIQEDEENCLEYNEQVLAAERKGIPGEKVRFPKECQKFREKYKVALAPGQIKKRKRKKRFVQGTGGVDDTLRWDNCIVPYNMSQIVGDKDIWTRIRGQRKYEYWTSFKFVEWNASVPALYELSHENYIHHIKTTGCYSFVGNIRAKQGQDIAACGGITAQHEVGHALGAHHTQANPTRDHYIKINNEFIIPSWRNQYTKKSKHKTDQWFHYDFGSILHYGIYSVSNQGLQTMAPYDLIHLYELINTDLYSFYLHKALDAVHQCAAQVCPSRYCHNEGFLSQLGYDNVCGCRCCEGLDPATNCTTIYRGSNEGAVAQWPGGTYSILKTLDQSCPQGFSSGNVKQYINWAFSSGASSPFDYDLDDGSNFITHKFCTKTTSSGSAFPRGEYCLLKYGDCPPDFVSGYAQFEDTQPPETQGTVPDGNYTTHTRLEFCCRQDGNYDDDMVFPYNEPFILFQQSNQGCQQVKDMAVISESIIIKNNSVENTTEFGGWLPHMLKYYKGTKYEIFFCYYHRLDYDCGGIIELTDTNPNAAILSPNYPLPYPDYKRCYWLIKSPPGTQILTHLHDYDIEDTESGTCADFIDVRYYGCGSTGKIMCGYRSDYGIRSRENLVTIIFGSDYSNGLKGFNATVSLVNLQELRYIPYDYGRSYMGKVNFTRTFKPCLHWADVTHCEHHPFSKFDLGKHLAENYCRSPGPGTEPWCYYEASQCMVDTCDVSLIEPCYDISTQCDDIPCTDEEASRVCNKKCACNANNDNLRGPPVAEVTCGPPPNMQPEAFTDSNKDYYQVGETVTYTCKKGVGYNTITCMTDGSWSILNYICHSCPKNWIPYKDACYRLFDTYMMKDASKQHCKNVGAEVVSIRTQDEQLFVDSIRDGGIQAWIGILYSPDENGDNWIWEDDGAIATYTNFSYGQRQGCAYMGKSGKWIGVKCDSITFKGVICKIQLSAREGCTDQRNDCKDLTLRKPTACVDYEEFRNYECPFTCGVCVPKNVEVGTCLNPNVNGNFTLLVGDDVSITAGNVFGYMCLDGYHVVEGDLFRICHTDGTLSGATPVCKLVEDMEVLINPMPIIQRRWVGNSRFAYFGLNEQHLIPKDGVLVEWIFYSLFPGQITFQVWENTTTANTFKLVGRTMLSSTGDERRQRLALTGSARINVKKGQYIGIHYPQLKGGITYDTCSLTLTGPYDNQLMSTTGQYYKGGFKVGQQYQFKNPSYHGVCKVFSFTARVI